VGHNCFLDLLFITQAFVEDIQHASYENFKQVVNQTFPFFYDTKHIIQALEPTMNETALEKVFNFVKKESFTTKMKHAVQCEFGEDFVAYNTNDAPHEAAYDAFMTGVVFAHELACNAEIIHSQANSVVLYGCEQSPMTLTRAENEVNLECVFLVSEFNSAFTNDSFRHEERFGKEATIKWVDDTTCIVTVKAAVLDAVVSRVHALKDWKVVNFKDNHVNELQGQPEKKLRTQ